MRVPQATEWSDGADSQMLAVMIEDEVWMTSRTGRRKVVGDHTEDLPLLLKSLPAHMVDQINPSSNGLLQSAKLATVVRCSLTCDLNTVCSAANSATMRGALSSGNWAGGQKVWAVAAHFPSHDQRLCNYMTKSARYTDSEIGLLF